MTMIEDVARAMFEHEHPHDGHPATRRWTFDGAGGEIQEYWRGHARAAIETMREPSDAMVDAGEPVVYNCYSPEPGEGLDINPALPIWIAMIDAALAEKS